MVNLFFQIIMSFFKRHFFCNHEFYRWKKIGVQNEPDIMECSKCKLTTSTNYNIVKYRK